VFPARIVIGKRPGYPQGRPCQEVTTMDRPPVQQRCERLALTCAALRGTLAGAVHAIISWLLDTLNN
jgi:hypothetical protein